MNSLPREIWIEIFEYLDPNSLGKILQVSKMALLAASEPSLWRQACTRIDPSLHMCFDWDPQTHYKLVLHSFGSLLGLWQADYRIYFQKSLF